MVDRTVLITGAARRVGQTITRKLHASGIRVAVHYRTSSEAAEELVETLNAVRPDSAFCLQADLLDTDALPSLVSSVISRWGRLDGLVNNASSFFATPLESVDLLAWEDLLGTNLRAPLFLAKAAAPFLRESYGLIVNITDIHAERPLAGYPLYCTAKAGLLGLTRALAIELAPEIRVNAIAPGPILWPDNSSFDGAARASIVDHTLLKHAGDPWDIARTVLFLFNDAPYITGQVINVDGGRTVHL